MVEDISHITSYQAPVSAEVLKDCINDKWNGFSCFTNTINHILAQLGDKITDIHHHPTNTEPTSLASQKKSLALATDNHSSY